MGGSEANEEPEVEVNEPTRIDEACLSCGGTPRWESITDHWGERWLAVCVCGRMEAFFPDRRQLAGPSDPLTLFLQGHLGPRRPSTPPWVRLFLHSVEADSPTLWRHSSEPCASCDASTVFGLLAWPGPSTAGMCTLCLNCGHTATAYANPARGTTEATLEGSVWAPPCPAVQRLRDCIHLGREQQSESSGGESCPS